jgi:hypothetical protein
MGNPRKPKKGKLEVTLKPHPCPSPPGEGKTPPQGHCWLPQLDARIEPEASEKRHDAGTVLTEIDLALCPHCKKGHMKTILECSYVAIQNDFIYIYPYFFPSFLRKYFFLYAIPPFYILNQAFWVFRSGPCNLHSSIVASVGVFIQLDSF